MKNPINDDHVCKSCSWTGDPVDERCPKCGSYDVQEIAEFVEEFNKIDLLSS